MVQTPRCASSSISSRSRIAAASTARRARAACRSPGSPLRSAARNAARAAPAQARPAARAADARRARARAARARGHAEARGLVETANALQRPLCGTLRLGVIPTVAPYYCRRAAARPAPAPGAAPRAARGAEGRSRGGARARRARRAVARARGAARRARDARAVSRSVPRALPAGHRLARRRRAARKGPRRRARALLDDGHCLRAQALAVSARRAPRSERFPRDEPRHADRDGVRRRRRDALPELALRTETRRRASPSFHSRSPSRTARSGSRGGRRRGAPPSSRCSRSGSAPTSGGQAKRLPTLQLIRILVEHVRRRVVADLEVDLFCHRDPAGRRSLRRARRSRSGRGAPGRCWCRSRWWSLSIFMKRLRGLLARVDFEDAVGAGPVADRAADLVLGLLGAARGQGRRRCDRGAAEGHIESWLCLHGGADGEHATSAHAPDPERLRHYANGRHRDDRRGIERSSARAGPDRRPRRGRSRRRTTMTTNTRSSRTIPPLALLAGGGGGARRRSRAARDRRHLLRHGRRAAEGVRSPRRRDDFFVAQAICRNGLPRGASTTASARRATSAARRCELCQEQRAARGELCDELGGGRYDPTSTRPTSTTTSPTSPIRIRTSRCESGYQWRYAGGGETIEIEVLDETKLDRGCDLHRGERPRRGRRPARRGHRRLVRAAQGRHGLLLRRGGEGLRDLPGRRSAAARARRDRRLVQGGPRRRAAGHAVPRAPRLGEVYRQEWSPNNAEDAARVLSTTYDFGIDPELDEHVPEALAELLCDAATAWSRTSSRRSSPTRSRASTTRPASACSSRSSRNRARSSSSSAAAPTSTRGAARCLPRNAVGALEPA